jgi:hypothetical protein
LLGDAGANWLLEIGTAGEGGIELAGGNLLAATGGGWLGGTGIMFEADRFAAGILGDRFGTGWPLGKKPPLGGRGGIPELLEIGGGVTANGRLGALGPAKGGLVFVLGSTLVFAGIIGTA